MSFLNELENDKKQQNSSKTPRQLWEGCFKYFRHFVSILSKNKEEFPSEFNFIVLNVVSPVIISGPFEITRVQNDEELKLELKFNTIIDKNIRIKRKDQRSAELLKIRLSKDGVLSTIHKDTQDNHSIVLNNKVQSVFRILLKNNEFFIEYSNIASSSKKSVRLAIDKVNEKGMDELAKYILGQNPNLYKETISDQEITKIREKIHTAKLRKKLIETEIQAESQRQKEVEQLKKENSLKEKSKRFITGQHKKFKSKLLDKFKKP